MPRIIQLLLGTKPAPWAQGGQWRLEWTAWPGHDRALLLMIAIGLAVWGVLYLYRREGRNLGLAARLVLTSLRMLVLLSVLVMLLEPMLVFSKKEWAPSKVLVLADDSQSMDLRDAYVDPNHATAVADALKLSGGVAELRELSRLSLVQKALSSGLLDKLAAGGDRTVQVHSFATQLQNDAAAGPSTRPLDSSTGDSSPGAATQPSSSDRAATGLGTAIRQAIASYRGQPLAGVLVISDAQWNTGESPIKAAEFAAGEGVPLIGLSAGTPEGPRNARLTKIEVSPVVFVRDPNPLRVVVESRGMGKSPATLVLEKSRDGGPWEESGRQSIIIEESGQVQTVGFEFKEDKPTKLQFRASLVDAGAELTTEDNTAAAEVRVIRQKIRVLFIAGSTFPEVEFIRNAILRDTALSASTWLMTADARYDQPGNPPIKRLPATQEELNEFDCIILYDPEPTLWPTQYPQFLTDFVAKAGGGLVYVAGERNTKNLFDHQDDPATSWLSLLPVVSDQGLYRTEVSMKLSAREEWKLEITPEGKTDPIFRFAPRAEDNETILAHLPGMYWHFPVTRAKPGATVLARHADPRMRNENGGHVLLATQLVGPGRTFFVAFDSTYRWRYLDDRYFDSFWAQMIDRAGRSKQLGGRYPYTLSTDRPSYRPGSQVTLVARFDNPSDRDAALEALHGEAELGGQPPIPLTLAARQGDPGAFEAAFAVPTAGACTVRVWSGDQDLKTVARAATLQFPVELPNLEYERPTLDLATLQAMAKTAGGSAFDMSQLEKIPDAFKIKRVGRVLEDRQEVWNAPLLFGVMLLAITVEWLVRKRVRLV